MSESKESTGKINVHWNAAIILTLIVYGVGFTWYLAKLDAKVDQTIGDINKLQSTSSVLISRDQLEDILGGRDEKIDNIENKLVSIEEKLDEVLD